MAGNCKLASFNVSLIKFNTYNSDESRKTE